MVTEATVAVETAALKARVMRVTNTVVMALVGVQVIKAGVMIMVAAVVVLVVVVDITEFYITKEENPAKKKKKRIIHGCDRVSFTY